MARRFGGILGYLAAAIVLLRGAVADAGIESTLLMAITAAAMFLALGIVLGMIAEGTVVGSVREQFQSQIDQTTNDVAR
jgi:hypothetical protein